MASVTAPVDGARNVAIRSSDAGSRCARDGVTAVPGIVTGSGRTDAIQLLDALNAPEFDPWTLVDAVWTSKPLVGANRDNGTIR